MILANRSSIGLALLAIKVNMKISQWVYLLIRSRIKISFLIALILYAFLLSDLDVFEKPKSTS